MEELNLFREIIQDFLRDRRLFSNDSMAIFVTNLKSRLSLNMKLERRLVFSLDPLHPNILVSANVPKIAFQLDVDNMK